MLSFYKSDLSNSNRQVCTLQPPIFVSDGKELSFAEREDGSYVLGAMNACDTVENFGDGLYRVTRKIENTGRTDRTGKLLVELCDSFVAEKHTIPCVMFDGNEKSGGKEPHGLTFEGTPWLFAYDRAGIPSCTITEDKDTVCALFASDADAESLTTSCGFLPADDGKLAHRICYPVTEAPYSYVDHDVLGPRYDTYLTIRSGESFTVSFYVFVGTPKWLHYGTATLLDRIENLFAAKHEPTLTVRQVHDASLRHSRFFLTDFNGAKMFRNAMRNDPNSDGIYMPYTVFEAGWSGQCMKQARQFINEYAKTGDREMLEIGISCMDAWAASQFDNGLFAINYVRSINKNFVPCDVCNYGWAAAEMARTYALLKTHGIDKPEYLQFAEKVCDFFVAHYDAKTGYGLKWTVQGEKVADGGSIGGFMVMALIEVYKVDGKEEYLENAKTAMRLYAERDIDHFVCMAGAIDCACVDKETAYPFIKAALDLYDLTNEARYLEIAEKAAYYFQSWMFYYDALYPADSDFAKLGYTTYGGTGVSTQHPAIDPWGEIAIPEYLRLAKLTGDDRWKQRARAIWYNATLCIAPKGGWVIGGHYRPEGLQSEAFFQARWTRYRHSCEERGHLNDMYAGWPAAFRLETIDRIEKELAGDYSAIEKG